MDLFTPEDTEELLSPGATDLTAISERIEDSVFTDGITVRAQTINLVSLTTFCRHVLGCGLHFCINVMCTLECLTLLHCLQHTFPSFTN